MPLRLDAAKAASGPSGTWLPFTVVARNFSVSCAALEYARHPPLVSVDTLFGNAAIGVFPLFDIVFAPPRSPPRPLPSYRTALRWAGGCLIDDFDERTENFVRCFFYL